MFKYENSIQTIDPYTSEVKNNIYTLDRLLYGIQNALINRLNDGKFYGILNLVKIEEFRGFLSDIIKLYHISQFDNRVGIIGSVLFIHYNIKIRPLYIINNYRDRIDVLSLEIYKLEELLDYLTRQLEEGKVYMQELDDVKDFAEGL